MLQNAVIRDFRIADLPAVQRIHDATEIDYNLPNLASSLFLVTKVLEVNGVVRQCGGAYLQAELYLWADQSDWAEPANKLDGIKQLEQAVVHGLWLKGIDQAVLWLPPGMERFGERLEEMGFSKDRDGWRTYSKDTR